MSHDRNEIDDKVASGAICPMADCGALMVSYRLSDSLPPDFAELWEFTCPLCGTGFAVSEADLIFRAVPKDWLLAKIHTT